MIISYFRRLKTKPHWVDADKVCDVLLTLSEQTFPWAYNTEYEDKQRHQARFEAISMTSISFMYAFRETKGLCQAVHDALFDRFDASLREQGVGDIAMSHRMKKYAAAFAGRLNHYTTLMAEGDKAALTAAIAKNTGYEQAVAETCAAQMLAWAQAWQKAEGASAWVKANSLDLEQAS